jgi:transposase
MDELLQMSVKELTRLEVMQRLTQKRMSPKEAGRMLGLSTQQIKRLLKRYRQQGAAGPFHTSGSTQRTCTPAYLPSSAEW